MKYGLKKYVLQLIAIAFLPVIALSLTGCVTDDSACLSSADGNGEQNAGATMSMRFTVVTRSVSQRAKQERATRPAPNPQTGTPAENYLDLKNITFLLFDDRGNLITPFYPNTQVTDAENYITYSVTATMPQSYFDYATGDDVTFHIMVYGNISSHNPKRQNYTPGLTFAQLFGMDMVTTFGYPLAKAQGNFDYWWEPGVGQYIPMSGLQVFTVSKAALKASTADNPYELSVAADGSQDINMLRAVAKIEVIDRLGYDAATGIQAPADDRLSIDKVELLGYFNRASMLPMLANWHLDGIYETQYVSTASIPSDAIYQAPVSYADVHPSEESTAEPANQNGNAIVDFYEDAVAAAMRDDKCRVFSAYVPEYAVGALAAGTVPAFMQVTVHNPGETDENANPVFELKLASYTNGSAGDAIDLLRNNIYRYEINNIGQQMGINWTVCAMDTPEAVVIPPFN